MTSDNEIVVVDTETTGLDPDNDPIWEVAAVRFDLSESRRWFLPIHVGLVSDWVKEHTGFCERYDLTEVTPHVQFIEEFSTFVGGAHMAGNVVSFDAERLQRIYAFHGRAVPWHYHLIDVEAVAVGFLLGEGHAWPALPWNSRDLSRALGVEPPEVSHQAMEDALWARDVLAACMRETNDE